MRIGIEALVSTMLLCAACDGIFDGELSEAPLGEVVRAAMAMPAHIQRPAEPEAATQSSPNEPVDPSSENESRGELQDDTLEARLREIDAWQEPLRRCRTRPRRHCDGPRRVPVPTTEDAARAERLHIGSRRDYGRILSGPAEEALLAEAHGPNGEEAEASLLWPVAQGTMGRGFGYTRTGGLRQTLHRGVDIPAATGAEVRAANAGLVIYADNGVKGYGNLVVILHSDDTRTFYAHLEAAVVSAGQRLRRGELVGAVGRTGLTRAPHLHFEYRRRAVPRDPRRRFMGRPRGEEEQRLLNEQRDRRRAGEARLAELRARAERRRQRLLRQRDGSP